MKTYAQSRPPSRISKNPPAKRIFKKSTFCKTNPSALYKKNTDSFPGFLGLSTPASRVTGPQPSVSQNQCALTLPAIQANPLVQPGKNIKMRNEVNLTSENSEAANPGANPTPSSLLICVLLHVLNPRGTWPEMPNPLTRLTIGARCRRNQAWLSTDPAPFRGTNS